MGSSLEVRGLRVRRGAFELAVESLAVSPREVFAILGPTGSGKTVLLESIAGAYKPSAGQVLQDGVDVSRIRVQQRCLGIVYQDYLLFPHMTVLDNVAYGLKLSGCSRAQAREQAHAMLARFSVEHIASSYPSVISGGESQRVSLARALVLKPSVLLLDEPFSALDPSTKERLYATLEDVHASFDCTIVFVTHDFSEAQRLADRVGIILDGRLRAVVAADSLFAAPHDDQVTRFLGLEKPAPPHGA